MYRTRSWMRTTAIIAAACALLAVDLLAATETVLHNFKSKEGASPILGLIFSDSGFRAISMAWLPRRVYRGAARFLN